MDVPSFFHQWPLVSTGDLGPVSFGSLFCHEDPHHPFSLQPAPDDERAPESTQLESNKPLKHLKPSTSTSTFSFHKQMDKASVIGDATKYIKQLQEYLKILEEQTKKKSIESVVFVKRNLHCSENSSTDKSGPTVAEPLPEIEARFSNDDILINILCEKRNGSLEKTVAEIEKLHLSVVNSSAMTFGDSALYIAAMAKKDEGRTMNTKELIQN